MERVRCIDSFYPIEGELGHYAFIKGHTYDMVGRVQENIPSSLGGGTYRVVALSVEDGAGNIFQIATSKFIEHFSMVNPKKAVPKEDVFNLLDNQ